MANKTYSELLKDPRWQKKRLEIMKRDKWRCKLCGDDSKQLHIHHKEYISGQKPWEYQNELLVTVCEDCHFEISRDEMKDFSFDKLKVLKLDKWNSGSKIMFTSIKGNGCSMTIYDKDDNWIIGFTIDNLIPDIIKILKVGYNG